MCGCALVGPLIVLPRGFCNKPGRCTDELAFGRAAGRRRFVQDAIDSGKTAMVRWIASEG